MIRTNLKHVLSEYMLVLALCLVVFVPLFATERYSGK